MKSSSCISGGETEAIFLPSLSLSLSRSLSALQMELDYLNLSLYSDGGAVQRYKLATEHIPLALKFGILYLCPKANSVRSN